MYSWLNSRGVANFQQDFPAPQTHFRKVKDKGMAKKKYVSVVERNASGRHERNRDDSGAINNQNDQPITRNPRPSLAEQAQEMKNAIELIRRRKHQFGIPAHAQHHFADLAERENQPQKVMHAASSGAST